jgi:hypothetical protein
LHIHFLSEQFGGKTTIRKTMRNVFISAIVVVLSTVGALAQATDNVTVNIKLQPIHTLVVNSGQKAVNLVYSTKNHYNEGVSVDQADHLEVFSTGAFEIRVKTDGDFKSGSEAVEASSVKVTSSAGTSKALTGSPTYSAINLSNVDQALVKSATGGRDVKVNINYKGAGTDTYLNKFSKARGASENVYTAQVTYTIVAD